MTLIRVIQLFFEEILKAWSGKYKMGAIFLLRLLKTTATPQ